MISIFRSWIWGLSLPMKSARLILTRPKLLAWSIAPVLITLALTVGLASVAINWVGAALPGWLQWLSLDPSGWFGIFIGFLIKIVAVIAAALMFSALASLVATPFNDFLAEAAEPHSTPALPRAPEGARIRLLVIDAVKTIVSMVAFGFVILVGFIPGAQILAFPLACLLVTFQYVSFPATRRREGVRDGFRFLARHPFSCLGLGMALVFLIAIPFISVIAIPLAVVSGTLLYARAAGDPSLR